MFDTHKKVKNIKFDSRSLEKYPDIADPEPVLLPTATTVV